MNGKISLNYEFLYDAIKKSEKQVSWKNIANILTKIMGAEGTYLINSVVFFSTVEVLSQC